MLPSTCMAQSLDFFCLRFWRAISRPRRMRSRPDISAKRFRRSTGPSVLALLKRCLETAEENGDPNRVSPIPRAICRVDEVLYGPLVT